MRVFDQVFNGTELALEVALARLPPGALPRRDESAGAAQMPIQVLLIGICCHGGIVIRQLLASWPPGRMLQRHQAGVCKVAAGVQPDTMRRQAPPATVPNAAEPAKTRIGLYIHLNKQSEAPLSLNDSVDSRASEVKDDIKKATLKFERTEISS